LGQRKKLKYHGKARARLATATGLKLELRHKLVQRVAAEDK